MPGAWNRCSDQDFWRLYHSDLKVKSGGNRKLDYLFLITKIRPTPLPNGHAWLAPLGRTGARRPLVVGDRLDTDVEGGRRAGAATLLVLTGVTDPATLLAAGPDRRPDLLAPDAAGLLTAHPAVVAGDGGWRCGGWTVRSADGVLRLGLDGVGGPADADGLDGLRALCVAHWTRHPEAVPPAGVTADDEAAAAELRQWGLAS